MSIAQPPNFVRRALGCYGLSLSSLWLDSFQLQARSPQFLRRVAALGGTTATSGGSVQPAKKLTTRASRAHRRWRTAIATCVLLEPQPLYLTATAGHQRICRVTRVRRSRMSGYRTSAWSVPTSSSRLLNTRRFHVSLANMRGNDGIRSKMVPPGYGRARAVRWRRQCRARLMRLGIAEGWSPIPTSRRVVGWRNSFPTWASSALELHGLRPCSYACGAMADSLSRDSLPTTPMSHLRAAVLLVAGTSNRPNPGHQADGCATAFARRRHSSTGW